MAETKKKRLVFLCSGGGGNLCFIHHAIERNWIRDAEIVAVLTDRVCKANLYADAVGLENQCLDFGGSEQVSLLEELRRIKPDLVITTVNKVLRKNIVEAYKGRLINLHYSLLPAFGGLIGDGPIRAAVAYGARFTGVTVHFVDESVDGGSPILQTVIPLHSNETGIEHLMNIVFRNGCITLMRAIDLHLHGEIFMSRDKLTQLEIMGRLCHFTGGVPRLQEFEDEIFWKQITKKLRM